MAAHDQVEVPGPGTQDRIRDVAGRMLLVADVGKGDDQVAALLPFQEVGVLLHGFHHRELRNALRDVRRQTK